MTNYDVLKKLIGNIEPIGDSRVDEKRFENLKETTLLVEQLLRDIHAVVSFSDCSQASMNKAGRWAKECLDGFRMDLNATTAIIELETPNLINMAIANFDSIAEQCSRVTSGNFMHDIASIKGKAIRNSEYLKKHHYDKD